MRLLAAAIAGLALSASNLGGAGVPIVCETVIGTAANRPVAACRVLVDAVLDDASSPHARPVVAAVWLFSGCPPGTYCGVTAEPATSPPVSALVGIRFAGRTELMWTIPDVDAHVLGADSTEGYDAQAFIEGLTSSVAAARAP